MPAASQPPQNEEAALHGMSLPLDVLPSNVSPALVPETQVKPYSPDRQRDYVRLIVTCGMLLILGYLVVWATVESASYPAHWQQTKELLQIMLPALTGIIGTVIGFYFGTAAMGNRSSSDD